MESNANQAAKLSRHFGHGPLADSLAREILDSLRPAGERTSALQPKTREGLGHALVVGVFGEWGAGKSFLLKEVGEAIKHQIQEQAQAVADGKVPAPAVAELNVLVDFNAWRYEREPHLLIPMLKVAEEAVREAVEALADGDTQQREWLNDHLLLMGELIKGVYTHGGREALNLLMKAGGADLTLPEIKPEDEKKAEPGLLQRWGLSKKEMAAERKVKTPIAELESLYFNFYKYLKGITGRNPAFLAQALQRLSRQGSGPLVDVLHKMEQAGRWVGTGETKPEFSMHLNLIFLVDDLDRCLPENAIEVLEAVKLFLDVEGCAFVLALDEEVVERGIAHRYQAYTSAAQGHTPITGAEYLEKLIHLPIRLPRPSESEAQRFLVDHWPSLYAVRPDLASPHQPNDLAKLVSAITPPVPRTLQRITSLIQLNKAFSGAMRSDSGPMTEADQRAWLALICALQLFAPSLFRYLRLHGAGLMTEVIQWRSGLRLNDLTQLKLELREATVQIKEVAQLRDAYAREALPDLVGAAVNNRSGFSLITWCAEAERLMERAPPSPTQLGFLLSLTVHVELAEESTAVVDNHLSEVKLPSIDEWVEAARSVAAENSKFERESSAAEFQTSTPITFKHGRPTFAALDREGDFLEALMARDSKVLSNALAREGPNLQGKYLPDDLVDRWAELLKSSEDHWLLGSTLPTDDPRPAVLSPLLTQAQVLRLSDAQSNSLSWLMVLQNLRRPSWTKTFGGAKGRLSVEAPLRLSGMGPVMLEALPFARAGRLISPRAWLAVPQKLGIGTGLNIEVGADGEYGLYLNLTIQGITQRLRWMEPGSFLMGSPEWQGARDEHPHHPVTLRQGFWLADTPCTQALWQAVMGENPSEFKSAEDADQCPVENVSFDEVQAFSDKLGEWLPAGWYLGLPTEAEWEYACRAGTQTAYWWGDEPDHRQANWHQQQKGTTAVTQYPPNPWGLHDVHGNVWEWCADGKRVYSGQAETDPVGNTEGDARVVRGGSWIARPDSARSAYRSGGPRGYRNPLLGFRFALRSSRPGAEPGGRAAEPA